MNEINTPLPSTNKDTGSMGKLEEKKLVATIKMLMHECGNLKEADLIRHTNLPQATVNRLLQGETLDPRIETLRPIAKFFGVTIGQLVGDEPLLPTRIPGTYNPTSVIPVPIIKWTDILAWESMKSSITPYNQKDWIIAENNFSSEVFALKSLLSMEPLFPKDSILIVDAKKEVSDGDYAIVTFKENHSATVRQIACDGGDIYLRAFDKAISTVQYNKKIHEINGIVVEVRINI